MLIFANGAVKSGSTWLFHLARELTGFGPPPDRYANPKWHSQPVYSIDQEQLAAFLGDAAVSATNLLTKNHFGAKHDRDRLLAQPQVRVLNIRRDVRDVIVSAYYHGSPNQTIAVDFQTYYWPRGRQLAQRVLDYQIIWDVRSPRYLCFTYETLVENFPGEVSRLGHFLGVPLTPKEIERIRQATSPATLNERYAFSDFNRFRAGRVGDWQHHFDDSSAADLAAIIKRSRQPLHRLALTGPRVIRRLCRPWRQLVPDDNMR